VEKNSGAPLEPDHLDAHYRYLSVIWLTPEHDQFFVIIFGHLEKFEIPLCLAGLES